MLELKKIKKSYTTGDITHVALKNVSLKFRESEFVSILGPSGSGKTTLLNIVGGLDRYDTGDLVINGRSTKEYKDRDWDTYRNHSVGFVFQSYNLITHQSVLSNVELALTLSGVSKEERRNKAIKVLEEVGLKDQIYKKPNQLSGGQMQRVAIARALVNDPDIILADEPTGALDTKTSEQIMDILKKISKNKLIIMVTHNPEIAQKYSSRIIKVLDGNIVDDSDPFEPKEKVKDRSEESIKKSSMNFWTALNLSFNNLMTKKGRTFLTAFAGSIGIIGIALIMSLSNGVQNYISRVEEETLASYPIVLEKTTMSMTDMIATLVGETETEGEKEADKVHTNMLTNELMSMMSNQTKENNLKEFKEFLESDECEISSYTNAIRYTYDLDINIYNENAANDSYVKVYPTQIMKDLGMGGSPAMGMPGLSSSIMTSNNEVWRELLNNPEFVNSQYDVLQGKMPENFDEAVIIVNEKNELTDYTLYVLGILNPDEFVSKYKAIMSGKEVEKSEAVSYSYDELLEKKFKLVLNTDYYAKEKGMWIDKSENEDFMKNLLSISQDIKIVGIVRPNSESVGASNESGGIGYSPYLKDYVIEKNRESEIAKEQLAKENINVFTGLEFTDGKKFNLTDLTNEEKMYLSSLNELELANIMEQYSKNGEASYEENLKQLGVVEKESPNTIGIYPKDFEAKEKIASIIEDYNNKQRNNDKEENTISYTDLVGMLMKSVTSIIDIISYVLMAFVSVSLIVSSIMIGIITYISVLERTKEIGILRSIGASKKDVSRVFNAETLVVGLASGLIGIGVTLLFNIPINAIVKSTLNVSNICVLPVNGGIILVLISVVLTVIAGLIPSKMASKKDPVEALRMD